LRDIADAFKQHRPDQPSATVTVSTDVVLIGTGYGQMRCGAEQVVVTTKDGRKRVLSSVLQNVFDARLTPLGQPLPPIGGY
jgi:hypothetical protein